LKQLPQILKTHGSRPTSTISRVWAYLRPSPTRRGRRYLTLEEAGETRVSELVGRLSISQPTMSQHLGILKNTGLVEDRCDGQSICFWVNRVWLTECCSGFISRFEDDEDFVSLLRGKGKKVRIRQREFLCFTSQSNLQSWALRPH